MNEEKNYEVMLSVFLADYLDCERFISSIRKKVRKRILQSTIFPVNLGPFEYETKSKRKCLIYVSAYSKNDCTNPFLTIVNYVETKEGYKASTIILTINGLNVITYSENVFKSYKDYFYEDSVSGFEVLKEFFKTNSTNVSEDMGNKLLFQCEDGLLAGFKLNETIKVMNSFTPNDLIENELLELSSSMLTKLEKVVELKKKSVI